MTDLIWFCLLCEARGHGIALLITVIALLAAATTISLK